MGRVILGLLKGAIVGVGVGLLAFKLGVAGGAAAFVTYGLVGALVGVVGGRPPWRQDTLWTSGLKGIFGLLVGVGLYWATRKLAGGVAHVPFVSRLGIPDRPLVQLPVVLAPVFGALWGMFVEVDDSAGPIKPTPSRPR